MYSNLTDAVAREHRSDLRSNAAAARTGRRGGARRGARNGENHSVATAARALGRPFVAFHSWYAAGEL